MLVCREWDRELLLPFAVEVFFMDRQPIDYAKGCLLLCYVMGRIDIVFTRLDIRRSLISGVNLQMSFLAVDRICYIKQKGQKEVLTRKQSNL